MSWLVPRSRLTPEQIRAVELPPSEHRLILGGPGSGKTQVLLHRAEYLRHKLGVPTERFRIFVYTNVLTQYIASALSELDIPESSVSTFASWAKEFHWKNLGATPTVGGSKPDWPQIYRQAADFAERAHPSLFDFVLVDEGQDLDENTYRLLHSVSKHVTVCMDHKQQIYDHTASESAILERLGMRKNNIALLDALRCSPYVISVAAALVARPEEGRQLSAQTRTSTGQRETPVIQIARDRDEELAKLVDVIRTRQFAGDRIGIFFATNYQMSDVANNLRQAGLKIEVQTDNNLKFTSDLPKLLTYHSAKGLTFDSVLMPCLANESFPRSSQSQIERLLFVGVSRAVKWAYFSTYEGTRFSPLDKVRALEPQGHITVLRTSQQRSAEPSAKPPAKPPSDDQLDFL